MSLNVATFSKRFDIFLQTGVLTIQRLLPYLSHSKFMDSNLDSEKQTFCVKSHGYLLNPSQTNLAVDTAHAGASFLLQVTGRVRASTRESI